MEGGRTRLGWNGFKALSLMMFRNTELRRYEWLQKKTSEHRIVFLPITIKGLDGI